MVSCGGPATVDRRLVGLMAVRNAPCYETDRKVRQTPMPRMLNVEQMLELVKHRFHQRRMKRNTNLNEGFVRTQVTDAARNVRHAES